MWPYRFIKRLPQGFRRLKQKPLEKKRLDAEDISTIQTWYDRFEIAMEKYQIQLQDLYNFDEVGFQEGQGKAETVITKRPELNGHIGANYSRSLITVIECVAADGSTLPPCIILPGKSHLEDWFTHSSMPDNWLISVSSTGYTSDEIAFNWVQHFDLYSRKRQIGNYRLLLIDNHGSHLTYDFIQYCEENKIILFPFPPHTTHFIQPLDGVPFQQYKHYHGKEVNKASRLGLERFEKREFLEALPRIRAQTFKAHTVQSGFSQRGISPLNPSLVTNMLEKRIPKIGDLQMYGEKEAQGPRPSSSSSSSSQSSHQIDIQQLRRSVSKAQKHLGDVRETLDSIAPKANRYAEDAFKKGIVLAELGAQDGHDIMGYLHAAKRQKQPRSRRQVNNLSSTGVLTVRDANRQIETRKAHEINKDRQRVGEEMDEEVAQRGLNEVDFGRETPGGENILPVYYDGPIDK